MSVLGRYLLIYKDSQWFSVDLGLRFAFLHKPDGLV
jgi:hypothetical protein